MGKKSQKPAFKRSEKRIEKELQDQVNDNLNEDNPTIILIDEFIFVKRTEKFIDIS